MYDTTCLNERFLGTDNLNHFTNCYQLVIYIFPPNHQRFGVAGNWFHSLSFCSPRSFQLFFCCRFSQENMFFSMLNFSTHVTKTVIRSLVIKVQLTILFLRNKLLFFLWINGLFIGIHERLLNCQTPGCRLNKRARLEPARLGILRRLRSFRDFFCCDPRSIECEVYFWTCGKPDADLHELK